ncbi:HECT-like ubiquitin-conjugating enzyme-binding-domain-containing protein [Gorgonomyces haynaldii]|nr:HECT-like ubiquitin-conjugating enzyme-binding-domain-containing protein [Gorgonomyces haynaldii]
MTQTLMKVFVQELEKINKQQLYIQTSDKVLLLGNNTVQTVDQSMGLGMGRVLNVQYKADTLIVTTEARRNPVRKQREAVAVCGCGQSFTKETKIMKMPSNYWYELLDCWQCHEEVFVLPGQEKGQVLPIQGRLLEGVTHFLVHKQDFDGILMEKAHCKRCYMELGSFDQGVYISKLRTRTDKASVFALEWKERCEHHAQYRFILKHESQLMLLWITDYNCTFGFPDLQNGIKVYYSKPEKQILFQWQNDPLVEKMDYPDLELFYTVLVHSTCQLPYPLQHFQSFNTAYLSF